MSSNVNLHRHFAMQNVSVAVRLDADGYVEDAYKKYLECIEFMTHQLLQDATTSSGPIAADSVLKFHALCQQCLERANILVKSFPASRDNVEKKNLGSSTNYKPQPRVASPATPSGRSNSQSSVLSSPSGSKDMSPIELAQWQNEYLIAMHKARIEKLAPNNQMTANLSLSLQRRMMENMAIAKQRQLVLEKKKEERLKRLQEEADRRFQCRAGMSPDELSRRKLYTEILEYEQDEKWLMELRRKVPEKCKDATFIVDCIQGILCDTSHPLSRLLKSYQFSIYQTACNAAKTATTPSAESRSLCSLDGSTSLSPMESPTDSPLSLDSAERMNHGRKSESSATRSAFDPVIGTLVSEAQAFLENLETMFVVTYEQFDDEDVRSVIRDSLEDFLFQPVWPHILSLFRHSTYAKEQTMLQVMTLHCSSSPHDIGVSDKFCLDNSHSDVTNPPYRDAIASFQSLVQVASPSKKLDRLVQSLQMICQCIDEFYANSGVPSPQMGADEMLPVLSYIVVRTDQPALVTECSALMEFMDEGSLMGERGYCLTSIMTAIDFLLTLASSKPAILESKQELAT